MSRNEQYNYGPVITVDVQDSSVGLPSATLKPTTGEFQGFELEQAIIHAVGAMYVETGGGAATTASFPLAAGEKLTITGHAGLSKLRMIRNTTNTTAVVMPVYR